MATCIYRERVQPPGKLLFGVACVAGIVVCVSLHSAIMWYLAPLPPAIALTIGFLAIAVSGYIIGKLTYGARIKVTTGGGIGYEQGVVLSTLGTSHSGRLYIPASDITNIEDYTFAQQSLLQSVFRPFALQEQLKGYVVKLAGYQGEGLRITYTHPPLYDSGRRESHLYLPTTNPETLKLILSRENPGS
ncbi:hypothetical protein [Pseudohalioglobus lutimaris]|nr:hypothetical protein [Pseudohalioglobus lutimaris]